MIKMAMNMMNDSDRLYRLLPAIYREQDEMEGFPLRALLRLISGQADLVRADVLRLWDNYFIETCDRWSIPYIGDLVGNNSLHDAHRIATPDTAHALFPDLIGRDLRPPIAIRTRADVARTIYYRRRKGTLPMLEEMARDVTGWPAHAVEYFELLGWNQYAKNHIRMHSLRTPDIRRIEPMDRLNGAFDAISHTVDVRPIDQQTGWYNIKNVGFFLWRLASYPMTDVRARQSEQVEWGFHFSALGNPAPLFSRWRREGDEAALATELHTAGPIRRAFFHDDLERYKDLNPVRPDFTDLYGLFEPVENVAIAASPESSFVILRNGAPVAPSTDPAAEVQAFKPQIVCRRLDPWPAAQPPGQIVAVDVERGRLAVGSGWGTATETIDVCCHYGFSADLGGGPYERTKWLVRPDLATLRLSVQENGETPGSFTNLGDAISEWIAQNRPNAVITILDNRTYEEPLEIEMADGRWLVIEAANGKRPHIRPESDKIEIKENHPGSELTLSGLLIEGAIHVGGDLGRLRLLHTTLVPGRGLKEDGAPRTTEPSVIVEESFNAEKINLELRVEIAFSITGPLRIPEHAVGLWLLDSVVDGLGDTALSAANSFNRPGPSTRMERVTVLGASRVKKLLLASETIFTGPVVSSQRQEGCCRFSFVAEGSETPRRYRCQPDLEIAAQIEEAEKKAEANNITLTPSQKAAIRKLIRGWLVPAFTSAKYGDPAYAQLHLSCPAQIRTGAEDGSEMGVFCHLKQPQRETNLRMRLEEYLPFGLEPGIIYAT